MPYASFAVLPDNSPLLIFPDIPLYPPVLSIACSISCLKVPIADSGDCPANNFIFICENSPVFGFIIGLDSPNVLLGNLFTYSTVVLGDRLYFFL